MGVKLENDTAWSYLALNRHLAQLPFHWDMVKLLINI